MGKLLFLEGKMEMGEVELEGWVLVWGFGDLRSEKTYVYWIIAVKNELTMQSRKNIGLTYNLFFLKVVSSVPKPN
ncbi:MAG: hypothetical protein RL679_1245 [Bacteroidota bacterium]|jgi:hypothetical protein